MCVVRFKPARFPIVKEATLNTWAIIVRLASMVLCLARFMVTVFDAFLLD